MIYFEIMRSFHAVASPTSMSTNIRTSQHTTFSHSDVEYAFMVTSNNYLTSDGMGRIHGRRCVRAYIIPIIFKTVSILNSVPVAKKLGFSFFVFFFFEN
jgi:hypothetical protein